MPNQPTATFPKIPRPPTHPVLVAGYLLLVGGLLGWLWTGEWRWAVTGVVLLLAAAIVYGGVEDKRVTPPAA